MKYLYFLLVLLLISSCIPLRIAPTIKDYKLSKGKKFKNHLPKENAFIFEDPKNANEFFLSFYEVEIPTKIVNLLPIFANAALENKGIDPLFGDPQVYRTGNWYLALFVYDADMKDCLKPGYPSRTEIIKHLQAIKKEYLTTNNYLEAFMKMN